MFVCLAIIVIVGLGNDAGAAVRACRPAVSSGPQTGTTLADGQKRAIAAWTQAAGLVGIPTAAWRLAATKSLNCQPFTERQVVCVATASPCAVEQVPGKPSSRGAPPGGPLPRVIPLPSSPAAKPLNI